MARDVARAAAELLARALRRRSETVLLLASGKTAVPIYRELARLHGEGRGPFRRARTFNLDELCVPAEDPRSVRLFMERHLFAKVDLEPGRIHFLRGDARDPEAECRRYEAELARFGPADIALVGIGRNGHVAYVEPGRVLPLRTSRARLSASTRRSLAEGGMNPVPRFALTVGIKTIASSREVLLVATGRKKAEAVAAALGGRISAACPASLLSLHPGLTVILDRAAAEG